MIIKDKVLKKTTSVTAKAGQKHEQDVAFYLRRAFKEHEQVFVFNDLKFTHNDEVAQIDHLILYPFGFILIESKSITGEVKINQQEEWSRSYNDKWQGMSSPIKQVELQQKLLRCLLFEHRTDILKPILFKQQGFAMRCWNNMCAVSSNAIIERDKMPKNISQQLVKAEFLSDKLQNLMKLRNKLINSLNIFDTRPEFSVEEMKAIADFLLTQDCSAPTEKRLPVPDNPDTAIPAVEVKQQIAPVDTNAQYKKIQPLPLKCLKCTDTHQLEMRSGKYGYYIKCGACGGNTPMKQACPSCKSKNTKVSKKLQLYTLNCQDCQVQIPLTIMATVVQA
ncbi:nuclease-related domain-containing protein [Moritella sp.]|uniref:nuclease-related domain-containing protein n=1 Tax=Moritella sp. TaxID=78556 RepID=UPI001DB0A59F|nr:nuclease-related domain-containing protein [Moritella sp.]MCJ8350448.1 NERD domain-containing protein [Moritella sp.]NQZ40142.1 NERD domain-containing protein [Moritella sp.]